MHRVVVIGFFAFALAVEGPARPLSKIEQAMVEEEWDRAELLLQNKLTTAPGSVEALSDLGTVYLRQNRLEDARKVLEKALSLDPANPFCHRTLGAVHLKAGRLKKAEQSFREAVRLNDEDAGARNFLAMTLAGLENYEEALLHAQRAIEIDPSHADAYYNLAVLYLSLHPPRRQAARLAYLRARELGAAPSDALENKLYP